MRTPPGGPQPTADHRACAAPAEARRARGIAEGRIVAVAGQYVRRGLAIAARPDADRHGQASVPRLQAVQPDPPMSAFDVTTRPPAFVADAVRDRCPVG